MRHEVPEAPGQALCPEDGACGNHEDLDHRILQLLCMKWNG